MEGDLQNSHGKGLGVNGVLGLVGEGRERKVQEAWEVSGGVPNNGRTGEHGCNRGGPGAEFRDIMDIEAGKLNEDQGEETGRSSQTRTTTQMTIRGWLQQTHWLG